jgi:glycosyltransferase involved in cell wall biosynthesis
MSASQKPLRVAYVMGDQFIGLDWTDGSAIHVHEIVKALGQIGNLVTLVSYRRQRQNGSETIATGATRKKRLAWLPMRALFLGIYHFAQRRFWTPIFGHIKPVLRGLRISRETYQELVSSSSKWDIVHERLAPMSLGGVLAARKLDVPLVIEVNAQILEEQATTGSLGLIYRVLVNLILNYTFHYATAIITVSRELGEWVIGQHKLSRDKVYVLPNAADAEMFNVTFDKARLKEKYPFTADSSVVITFVGNLKPWHGLNVLINAFARVLISVPKAKLIIVGDGNQRVEAEELCRDKCIEHAVVFTGFVAHAAVPEILAISDIAVAPLLPDRIRTGAMKIFEYMAAGVAIVASRLGQTCEVLEDGKLGVLVEPGNAQELAEAIVDLACDPAKRRSLGSQAREVALQKYTWTGNARRLNEIYDTCITQYHGNAR